MKRIAFVLITVASLIVLIFFASFYFVDREKRKVYYYNIYKDNNLMGHIKLERFITEDKIIYISTKTLEFEPYQKKVKSKLVIDKFSHEFEDFSEEEIELGAKKFLTLQNKKNRISFLSSEDSEFTYLENHEITKKISLFKKDSIITFPEIIKKFNPERGLTAEINCLNQFSGTYPPIEKMFRISLSKNEIFRYNNANVRTNHLIFHLYNDEDISVWTYGWLNTIISIEIPKEGIKINLTRKPRLDEGVAYKIENKTYNETEIKFKNGNIALYGSLTTTRDPNKVPAVILIADRGIMDRNGKGLFLTLADSLSKKGITVLRYDKRGVGKSEGDYSATSLKNSLGDIKAAIDYLYTMEYIDRDKIGIIGWGYGGYLGLKYASSDDRVKFMISLNSEAFNRTSDENFEKLQNFLENKMGDIKSYFNTIIDSYKQTFAIARSDKDWANLIGKKVYLVRTRENLENNFDENLKNLNIPVLILHGREDTVVPVEEADILHNKIRSSNSILCELKLFHKLGHNLGDYLYDGHHRKYIIVNQEVVGTITNYINKISVEEYNTQK